MATVLKGAKIFDGTGKNVIENGVIVIGDDGRIRRVGENIDFSGEKGITYDLKGKFVLPGLIDVHVHLGAHGMADTYKENLVEEKFRAIRAAKEMENTLNAGVTTVRNCGSVNHLDFSIKKAVEQGLIKGPRILACGQILSVTCSGTEYFNGLYRVCDGENGFRKAAREQLAKGADCLKVMATGAIMNPGGVPGAEQPDVRELEKITKEGNKLGKKVAAHAHGAQGIKNAVNAGVATIEHGSLADEEALSLMIRNNIYLVTTLLAGYLMLEHGIKDGVPGFMIEKSKRIRALRIDAVKRAIRAGVQVAMGSDAGISPYNYHGRNAWEVIVYVKEGLMSAEQAIISATQNAAQACGWEKDIGTIEEGKIADIIVVDGSPLENIEVLGSEKNIKMVFKDGKPVKHISPV